MIRYDGQGQVWHRVTGMGPEEEHRFVVRLATILHKWEGTPYMIGQQAAGVGVDCVRFVCAVLDEFLGLTPKKIEALPADAALHTRAGAIAGMKALISLYEPVEAIEDGTLEPADVIVTGPANGGPGHAMIVGPWQNELWHAAGPRVHRTGIGFIQGAQKIFRVYRLKNREVACSL